MTVKVGIKSKLGGYDVIFKIVTLCRITPTGTKFTRRSIFVKNLSNNKNCMVYNFPIDVYVYY